MPSVSQVFEIPGYYYFDAGNDFSGSKGDFAYKIINGERFRAIAWHGRLCSMKAEIEHEADFERTPDGFAALVKWLEETYNK